MSFDTGSCCRTEKLDNANIVEFRRGKSDNFTKPRILGSCSKVANNLENKRVSVVQDVLDPSGSWTVELRMVKEGWFKSIFSKSGWDLLGWSVDWVRIEIDPHGSFHCSVGAWLGQDWGQVLSMKTKDASLKATCQTAGTYSFVLAFAKMFV